MRFIESFNTSDSANEFYRSLHVGERLRVLTRYFPVKENGLYWVEYDIRPFSVGYLSGSLRYLEGGTVDLSMAVIDREISTSVFVEIGNDVIDHVTMRDALSRVLNRAQTVAMHGAWLLFAYDFKRT